MKQPVTLDLLTNGEKVTDRERHTLSVYADHLNQSLRQLETLRMYLREKWRDGEDSEILAERISKIDSHISHLGGEYRETVDRLKYDRIARDRENFRLAMEDAETESLDSLKTAAAIYDAITTH